MKSFRLLPNRSKINDFLVYGAGQAINLLSPLLVMPHLIEVCGEEGLGRIGVGFAMALILNGIVDYGSYIKGVKEISINRDKPDIIKERFKAIYLSKFFLLVIVTVSMSIGIATMPFFAKDTPLFFLSLVVVVGQFLSPGWFLQGTENFKWISFTNILSKAIYVFGVFYFITDQGQYIYANLFFGLGTIVANSIALLYLVKRYEISFKSFSIFPAIEILKEEFSLSMSQFFLSIYQFFPIIIISYVGGDFMAGQFRIIDQLVMILKSYLTIFFYFVYANVCFELNKNMANGINVWKRYNGVNGGFVLILIIVAYFNANTIFTYFNIDPSQIGAIIHYFKIALVVPLLIVFSLPLRQLMFAFEKERIYIIMTITATLLNVLLLLILTHCYGLEGAFLSIICIEFVIILMYCQSLTKHLKTVK